MLADGASATEALSSGYLLALGVSSVFLIVSLIPALFVPRG